MSQETTQTQSPPRRRPTLVASGLLAVAVFAAAYWWYENRLPRRFAEVAPGRLYRSGSATPAQLERAVREQGIRTVLCLLDPNAAETQRERAAAEQLGIRWLNVPLRGNGASTPADRDAIREILLEEQHAPLLVHCAAGVNRTGLAVGMFRLHQQNWTIEQVEAELLSTEFENLPKHENMREALREEARLAAERAAGPRSDTVSARPAEPAPQP